MDKEEFRVKLEEINNLVEKQDYKGAMNVVDSIDWRRVKNVRTLCVVGEIYAANKRYKDSKDIFLLAYHRAPIGKNILYRLIEISLKMNEIDEAMDFYEEYVEVAPNDNTQYILRYKINKARNASIESLISILEEYKEREFTEKWSYELAKLYYQAGDKKKCADLCDEMMLWFSDGKYVAKTLELKSRFAELTDAEKKIYMDHLPSEPKKKIEDPQKKKKASADEKAVSDEEAPSIGNITMDERDINNAESLQEKISKGIRDIFGGKKKDSEEAEEEKNTDEEEEQKEMIRKDSSEESAASVPKLEPEDVKPVRRAKDASGVMDIPSLKIPEEMKTQSKPELKKVAEKIEENDEEYLSSAKETQPSDEEEQKEFNLEDTILAAATAQGIEIPENASEDNEEAAAEEEKSEEEKSEEEKSEEEKDQEEESPEESSEGKAVSKVPDLEEEEFLSEEVLREAEEEFLNGPSSKKGAEEEEAEEKSSISEKSEKELQDFQSEINRYLDDDDDFDDDEPVQEAIPVRRARKKSPEPDAAEEKAARKVSRYREEPDYEDPEEEDLDDEDMEAQEPEEELSEEEELEKFIDSRDPRKMNPDVLIPREDDLTDEEVKLFTYFVKVPGMKDQLLDTLYDVQMAAADKTSRTGNIIVMGGRETGKTRLISSLIPAICRELNMEASKVAYVFADQINGKDISRIVTKLAGGFLVIEDANQLSPIAAQELDKAMEFRTDGLTVIVEDEKIGMRKFMARYPKLAKKFTSVINIPVFTNDELVNFARIYTKENGYSIDQMGMLALYNLISANQKEDEPMNIGAVKNLIDAAIAKSQGGIRKLKRNISKKATDHDGNMILYEKDFI